MAIHVLGIRHHGPGSAKHLVKALFTLQPDIILLEGPPEAEPILQWASHKQMKPPVALLAYEPENAQNAVFYPFATYSPEWQAIQYGLKNNIPVRMMDMPLVHKLALSKREEQISNSNNAEEPNNDETLIKSNHLTDVEENPEIEIRKNPIQYLADIAGYDDAEQWWEQHFELINEDALLMFETIKNMMQTLRNSNISKETTLDLQREVFMRRSIQQAENDMYTTIAVVCGAWHAPVLEQKLTLKQEKEILKDLPKIKVECTWIPWTNSRLMFQSGYGAGIDSPGWYEHQWAHPEDNGALWLSKAAIVFRKNNFDISSAHVIEAVRLTHSLKTLRNLNQVGLSEYIESIQTVMCMGDAMPLRFLQNDLIVGNLIGAIPDEAPKSPLQLDFEKQLKTLRLKISEGEQIIILDLRKPLDLEKSKFLHQLLVLNIDWGSKQGTNSKGTFKEQWLLYWKPEMLIEMIAKSSIGNTIQTAANTYLVEWSKGDVDLVDISNHLQSAILAELNKGIEALLTKLDTLTAASTDISALIQTLLPLADILKYGNVRKTNKEKIETIFKTLFYRITVGLPLACSNIDEKSARDMAEKVKNTHRVLHIIDHKDFLDDWRDTFTIIAQHQQIAPYVAGVVHKLLYETAWHTPEQTANAFSQALSVGNNTEFSTHWLEGFLHDAATILLLDHTIWNIIYSWVANLDDESFINQLPLLRRTFSQYQKVEKEKIAIKVKQGKTSFTQLPQAFDTTIDAERALQIIPTIEHLLNL